MTLGPAPALPSTLPAPELLATDGPPPRFCAKCRCGHRSHSSRVDPLVTVTLIAAKGFFF